MSEMRHLRCDRCSDDITIDPRRMERGPEWGWAYCQVGREIYNFCPNCWLEIKPKDLTKPPSEEIEE